MSGKNKTIQRLAWRLAQLSDATGLSLPFLRKEVREGKLPTRKIGSAIIVLHDDALAYLRGSDYEPPQSVNS